MSDEELKNLFRQHRPGHYVSNFDIDAARAIATAAYELAEQECADTAAEFRRSGNGCKNGSYDWMADGAEECAANIRALKEQQR